MKQILMDGFGGTLDTGWLEDLQVMEDKIIDRKELLVGIETILLR